MHRLLVLCALMLAAVGCESTGRFTVGVINETDGPLSAGLVKNGPPVEPQWASPFEVYMGSPQLAGRKWGTLVPPGEAVVIGPQTGRFARGVAAILRIYAADETVEGLMAISPGSRDRLDIPIDNGASAFVIRRGRDGLIATPAPPPPDR